MSRIEVEDFCFMLIENLGENPFQIIGIEIKLQKSKVLLLCIYRPPKQNLCSFLDKFSYTMDNLLSNYDRFIIVVDFNENTNNEDLKSFLKTFQLSRQQKTCFKSKQGTNIDLISSNNPKFHQINETIETGFSDHHLLVYTMLKSKFIKLPTKCVFYRN